MISRHKFMHLGVKSRWPRILSGNTRNPPAGSTKGYAVSIFLSWSEDPEKKKLSAFFFWTLSSGFRYSSEEKEGGFMIKKVDHMAIAVGSLEETKKRLEALFGAKFIVEKVNLEGQYRVAIFQIGENTFSFLESTSPEGFVAKHIERYGESPQHLGVEVDDLSQFRDHLHRNGVKTASYTEIPGVRKEVLVGAKNPLGIILQVFEWLGEYKNGSPETRMTKVWG
jgi:catechol 2,3-dioxygenase-like lactoylglutathione lyase family enzyme